MKNTRLTLTKNQCERSRSYRQGFGVYGCRKSRKNIAKFSKGLGWVGPAIDITDWFTELYKAVKTGNWRSLYVKTETIAVGLAATHVTALAFSAVLGGPIGILGYGLIMAGVGALVNETIVDEANKFIGL